MNATLTMEAVVIFATIQLVVTIVSVIVAILFRMMEELV